MYSYSYTTMQAYIKANQRTSFTGKPYIGELGYAFLFRNYRSDYGKWQTSDPLGYPDGWNNLAYCNNKINRRVDLLGLSELDAADYRKFIESQLAQGTKNIDSLLRSNGGWVRQPVDFGKCTE